MASSLLQAPLRRLHPERSNAHAVRNETNREDVLPGSVQEEEQEASSVRVLFPRESEGGSLEVEGGVSGPF